jgi:hypothetical protein
LYGISSPGELETIGLFESPPTDVSSAYLWAGYYMAAAGRLIGGTAGMSLGAAALGQISKATAWSYSPVTLSSGMTGILDDAAIAIQNAAQSSPGAGASGALTLAQRLHAWAQPAELAAYESSPLGRVMSWFETVATVVKYLGLGLLAVGAFGVAYYVYRYWKKP